MFKPAIAVAGLVLALAACGSAHADVQVKEIVTDKGVATACHTSGKKYKIRSCHTTLYVTVNKYARSTGKLVGDRRYVVSRTTARGCMRGMEYMADAYRCVPA